MKTIKMLVTGTALLSLISGQGLNAATVTKGTLEFEELASTVKKDLKDYQDKRQDITGDIKAIQKNLEKHKKGYSRSDSDKQKVRIKAQTLRETSRLLKAYSRYHELAISKVETVLPKLEKMKKAIRKSSIGKSARKLRDPEFRKGINNLYANLSSMAKMFGDKQKKAEIASLLKNNELLYSQIRKGKGGVKDIVSNIDKMTNYLRSMYARTVNSNMILKQKKEQTKYAIELMMYALNISKIRESMPEFSKMMKDIPEIKIDDYLKATPVFNNNEGMDYGVKESSAEDVDSVLNSYSNGARSLR